MAPTLTTPAPWRPSCCSHLLYLAALIIPGQLLLTHTRCVGLASPALGVALGISTGTLMWVAVAVFGVQQIFDERQRCKRVLRAVGGCYLLYLAWVLARFGHGSR